MGEQGLGGLGDDRADLRGIEVGAEDQQEFDDAIADGGIGEKLTEDRDAGRLIEGLGDGEELIRTRRTIQLADEFGDERSTDLGVERERGEHPTFGRQGLSLLRSEEGGDRFWLTLEIHAHEEALEVALIGGADLDRLAAATRRDGPFEGRAGETHQRAEGGGPLGGRLTEGLDGGGADFRVRVGGERGERFVMRRPGAEVAEGVHGLTADIAIGVGQQAHGQRPDLATVLAQHPEGLDAAGGRRGGVTGNRGERAFEGFAFVATVGQRLPGEMGIASDLRTETGDQLR